MRHDTATASAAQLESRAIRRQRYSLLKNLRKQDDTRTALRQEQDRLQKQAQRLRQHRLWLQLQARLDRVLHEQRAR